jgi:hypothetical protein
MVLPPAPKVLVNEPTFKWQQRGTKRYRRWTFDSTWQPDFNDHVKTMWKATRKMLERELKELKDNVYYARYRGANSAETTLWVCCQITDRTPRLLEGLRTDA